MSRKCGKVTADTHNSSYRWRTSYKPGNHLAQVRVEVSGYDTKEFAQKDGVKWSDMFNLHGRKYCKENFVPDYHGVAENNKRTREEDTIDKSKSPLTLKPAISGLLSCLFRILPFRSLNSTSALETDSTYSANAY